MSEIDPKASAAGVIFVVAAAVEFAAVASVEAEVESAADVTVAAAVAVIVVVVAAAADVAAVVVAFPVGGYGQPFPPEVVVVEQQLQHSEAELLLEQGCCFG